MVICYTSMSKEDASILWTLRVSLPSSASAHADMEDFRLPL